MKYSDSHEGFCHLDWLLNNSYSEKNWRFCEKKKKKETEIKESIFNNKGKATNYHWHQE